MNNSVNTFNKACASIRVKYQYDLDKSLGQNMLALSESEGYYERREQRREDGGKSHLPTQKFGAV